MIFTDNFDFHTMLASLSPRLLSFDFWYPCWAAFQLFAAPFLTLLIPRLETKLTFLSLSDL